MRHISSFDDHTIFFDKGVFDEWCVYIKESDKSFAPTDEAYFTRLQELASTHTAHQIYSDFVKIYDITFTEISDTAIELIAELAEKYGQDAKEIRKWFTVIYAGMVAEENKARKILGKRIKRLGIYQILIQGRSVKNAVSYSKGKNWRYLDEIMQLHGF